jgi:hypothetical protein
MTTEERIRRLQRALECGGPTHRLSDVIDRVKDSKAQFWEHQDAVIISEVNEFPLLKALNFWLISGDLQDVIALEPKVCAWGREQGCTIATATGRRGWGRVGHHLGWREWWPNFIKPLENSYEQ